MGQTLEEILLQTWNEIFINTRSTGSRFSFQVFVKEWVFSSQCTLKGFSQTNAGHVNILFKGNFSVTQSEKMFGKPSNWRKASKGRNDMYFLSSHKSMFFSQEHWCCFASYFSSSHYEKGTWAFTPWSSGTQWSVMWQAQHSESRSQAVEDRFIGHNCNSLVNENAVL